MSNADTSEVKSHHPSGKSLHSIFSDIPGHYDLINHIFTLGMDTGWRKLCARECLRASPQYILDICCGTGDLSLDIAKLADNNPSITGVDFSNNMLAVASLKAAKAGRASVKFVHADVAHLPFPDSYFDCAGVSFGFRNLTYQNPLAQDYLREILRVLKPGGKFVIVESSQPKSRFIGFFHKLYLRFLVFPIGFCISGDKSAYKYLASSAEHYFNADELKEYLHKAGFKHVYHRALFFGSAAIDAVIKPA